MPFQDQTVEIHPNGSLGTTEKLLKVPSQQLNGKIIEKTVEDNEKKVALTADVVVPLDGGYGWVVVVASFICCLVVDGIITSASMFNQSLQDEFHASESQVSYVVFEKISSSFSFL